MRALLAVGLAVVTAAPAAPPAPARLRSGALPPLAAMAVGGGEVFVDVTVNDTGLVTSAVPFRTTPPFTELVVDAVRDWKFRAAHDGDGPIESTVLVAAAYRPPSINVPTLGERPRDVGQPSLGTPSPVTTPIPGYPHLAFSGGVVLVEARVNAKGVVVEAQVVRSAPPFDAVAVEAARRWRFRPAHRSGAAFDAVVYIIFGFPAPAG